MFFAWRLPILAFLACFFLAPAVSRASTTVLNAARTGLQFASADFDGDNRADLATLQPDVQTEGRSEYFVRLWLSSSGRRFLFVRVAAPEGALSVQALDVNGDHAVDLVFTTRWIGQPVAVLLNDGHGHFTAADPASFSWSRQYPEFRPDTSSANAPEIAESGPESFAGRPGDRLDSQFAQNTHSSLCALVLDRSQDFVTGSLRSRAPPASSF